MQYFESSRRDQFEVEFGVEKTFDRVKTLFLKNAAVRLKKVPRTEEGFATLFHD